MARLRDAVATDAVRLGDQPWLAVVGIAAGLEHMAEGDGHGQAFA